MEREAFMAVVYGLLSDDPDSNRANRIIDAADEYAKSMKPKWILVNGEEGLPNIPSDKFIDVYCTVGYGNTKWTQELTYHDGAWYYPSPSMTICTLDVYAWTPKAAPEPWKGERKNETR